jgi:hypothetical protein
MSVWSKISATDALLQKDDARIVIFNTAEYCQLHLKFTSEGDSNTYWGQTTLRMGCYYFCLCNIGPFHQVSITLKSTKPIGDTGFVYDEYQEEWFQNICLNIDANAPYCAPRETDTHKVFYSRQDLCSRNIPEYVKVTSARFPPHSLRFRSLELLLNSRTLRKRYACAQPRQHNLYFRRS